MGLTYVTTKVSNIVGNATPFEASFLVDTGAIDCMVPASTLKALGVEVEGHDAYELANNDLVEYPYGHARIEFMGMKAYARVIFGDEECEPILGVVALEMVGFGVDPINKTLFKMSAKPLK